LTTREKKKLAPACGQKKKEKRGAERGSRCDWETETWLKQTDTKESVGARQMGVVRIAKTGVGGTRTFQDETRGVREKK